VEHEAAIMGHFEALIKYFQTRYEPWNRIRYSLRHRPCKVRANIKPAYSSQAHVDEAATGHEAGVVGSF
jgi:hypothetical protein